MSHELPAMTKKDGDDEDEGVLVGMQPRLLRRVRVEETVQVPVHFATSLLEVLPSLSTVTGQPSLASSRKSTATRRMVSVPSLST